MASPGRITAASLDRSNAYVQQHLRDHGFPGRPNGLIIETVHHGRGVATTVRTADPTSSWRAAFAVRLVDALGLLPGDRPFIRSREVRDLITVAWEGV